jgi:hypothetical protein
MMEKNLDKTAKAYATARGLILAERLGYGVHGSVWRVFNNRNLLSWALKIHREAEPYLRERDCYRRLLFKEIVSICGLNVPELIRTDDASLAIEMTMVERPFLLDFAGAWLDKRPEFSDEVWQQWEEDKRDMFEERWPEVRRVLGALAGLGIHMLDIHGNNIAFVD